MKYKVLGKTELKVSQLGFGAVQICRIPEKDAIDLIRKSIDSGINLIDTAHAYPDSEEILGKALKGIRDKVIISTKSFKTDKKEFLEDLKTSLKRLNTDYIDIFLFHDTSRDKKLDSIINNGLIEALTKERDKGRIGFIGFSCHNPDIIKRYYSMVDFSVLMMPVNFISAEFVDKNYKELTDKNIGILGMKPLGGGRIEDARISLKYVNQYEKIIPIIGMQSRRELAENLKLINTSDSLNDEDCRIIASIKTDLGNRFCRDCGYCLPCTSGINIPEINFIKVFFKQLTHDKVINPERTEAVSMVDECTECGKCEERCPYDLNIIDMIKENRDYYIMRKARGY
jgi:uncharacterized protein